MSRPLLEVRSLSKHFPVRAGLFSRTRAVLRAVDQVSFSLQPGQTFGLVGESGCGKSTLGRAILRLHEPTSGSVRLDGRELTTLDSRQLKAARKDMQIIFQDPYAALSPRRTVARILREPLDLHRIGAPASRDRRVAELLDVVGLSIDARHRYPHEFSGGQRQRIGIARALAVEPRLIVADEAVSALDVSVQSQVLNLMADLQREFGVAFLFIAHDLAVVQHVSHHVGVMYLGQLVETSSVERIYSMPAHPYTRALLDAVPAPDPGRRADRLVLEGEVPSPIDPPDGCAFHTRCPRAMPVCRRLEPRTIDIGTNEQHLVRCHLHDPGVESA
ncbi:MAG: ATP-binding cassette domain-containing protein [Wenzhouxiangellaceae bacterium]|nr:ATP-binding cassette domain-containing protein [Wenzhouxiangellaceae bacterium]